MNFLAAKLLLIENDPKVAFIVLSFILRQRHLLVLFDPHNSCLMDYMNIFHKRLRRHNRIVYRHLKLINFPPLCFTIEWFTTCFIVSSPGNLSTLVLDLIVAGFEWEVSPIFIFTPLRLMSTYSTSAMLSIHLTAYHFIYMIPSFGCIRIDYYWRRFDVCIYIIVMSWWMSVWRCSISCRRKSYPWPWTACRMALKPCCMQSIRWQSWRELCSSGRSPCGRRDTLWMVLIFWRYMVVCPT